MCLTIHRRQVFGRVEGAEEEDDETPMFESSGNLLLLYSIAFLVLSCIALSVMLMPVMYCTELNLITNLDAEYLSERREPSCVDEEMARHISAYKPYQDHPS